MGGDGGPWVHWKAAPRAVSLTWMEPGRTTLEQGVLLGEQHSRSQGGSRWLQRNPSTSI